MEKLVKKSMETELALNKNMEDKLNGNKAAGRRARKCTLALAKVGKQFREESLKAEK